MLAELDEMIGRFRQAQDRAVAILVNDLELPRPSSGPAWARFCHDNQLHRIGELRGVPFYAHGFGVQIEVDGVKIDFDWGQDGQGDGFDGWRLWRHFSSNRWAPPGTHAEVNEWLVLAHADQEIDLIGSLYYDPKRRASV